MKKEKEREREKQRERKGRRERQGEIEREAQLVIPRCFCQLSIQDALRSYSIERK